MTDPLLLSPLGLVLIACIAAELKSGRVPNAVTGPAILFGLLLPLYDQQWLLHVGGLFATLGLAMIPFMAGAAGGGQVKLLAAVGGVTGARFGACALAWFWLAAGFVFLVIFLVDRRRRDREEKPRTRQIPGSPLVALAVAVQVALEHFGLLPF